MYSVNLSTYKVVKGARGKNVFETPEQLASLLTLTQLNRVAEKMIGKTFNRGEAKSKVAAAICASLDKPIEKKTTEKNAPVVKTNGKCVQRVYCRIDPTKFNRVKSLGLLLMLRALAAGKTECIEVTRELFNKRQISAIKGGNAWRNFTWYKNNDYMSEVLV